MNVVQRISLLLFLGLPVLSCAQQSPAGAGSTTRQESSTPPAGQAVTFSHPASAPGDREGRIKLDVVVTDESGTPVSGLDLKDFTLQDNGQPSTIVSFHPVLAMDATVQKTDPPVEVILLIDAMNVPFRSVALVRGGMEKFLRQNGGRLAQPVSIYLLTNDGVSAQARPSVDGNAQAAALIQIDSKLRTIRASAGGYGAFQLFQESIQDLSGIAKSEAKKPGRKLLIWASIGWPMFDELEFSSPKMQQQYFETIVGLSTGLREARISLYGVSTGETLPFLYYKKFLKGVKTSEKATPANLVLGVLAEQSGGRVLGPDNDLVAQINSCVADAAAFYTISFDPPRADKTNEYHELKVQVGKPGLVARTSTGYYNQPLEYQLMPSAPGPTTQAATRVTVQQLEELIAVEHDQPDAEVARKLSRLELTERASSLRLSRWQTQFSGKRTREALMALADASAFLDLPAVDIPAIEMPDGAARKQILNRTVEYVRTTVHQLPNFLATRSTTHFEDLPEKRFYYDRSSSNGDLQNGAPAPWTRVLHEMDRATAIVTYREGHEVGDSAAEKRKKSYSPGMRLSTSGEFGPMLSVVIGDAIRGQVYWSHWERGLTGPLAVLRYVAPQEISHYSVAVDLVGGEALPEFPAYHGEITVDPTNGSILRLTAESELRPPHQTFKSGIVVEYGPVTIGNRDYICPIRSEALSRLIEAGGAEGEETTSSRFLTYLNDVTFTEYRLFRGDVRVLP